MMLRSRGIRAGLFFCGLPMLAGCGKKQVRASIPPPPSSSSPASSGRAAGPPLRGNLPGAGVEEDAQRDTRPAIYVETGIASWYGAPYHNRRGANGEVYDMNALTAAHKTLPLNSIARVTNLETGRQVEVRITDRGPFVGSRVIDLSFAAAKAVDVWRPGTAMVRVEVLQAPAPIDHGGRWAVQIGAFGDKESATEMKERLTRRYRTAKVLQFTGPTGEWLRVRVLDDDRARAQEVARLTRTTQAETFLVRLD